MKENQCLVHIPPLSPINESSWGEVSFMIGGDATSFHER